MSQNPTSEKSRLIVAIKEENILVLPETKVDVHIGIINQGPGEDYFDIRVKGVPVEWISLDTPAVHVGPGQAKQVILTIQPPALEQSRVGQYPLDVSAISQTDPQNSAEAHSVLTVAAYQSGGRIGVTMGSIHFSVAPGSSVTIPVLLQNQGLKQDVFQLSVEGIPASWITTNALHTNLEASQGHEIEFSIRVPRTPEAGVGRMPFKIVVTSQAFPDQKSEVDCILTVAAFSKFSATVQPVVLHAQTPGQLAIQNEGNTSDAYTLSFENPAGALIFEKPVPLSRPAAGPDGSKVEMTYVEIPQGETVEVGSGLRLVYPFRGRQRSRPLVGDLREYPYTVRIRSAENTVVELPAEISQGGFLPPWVAMALLGALALGCLFLLIPINGLRMAAQATQTAAFVQTQLAGIQTPLPPGADSDGDGLINSDEIRLGTDPLKPDTDGDGLTDGQEVNTYKTNPLVADTDQDGLSDGDEVLKYKTNPLNADTDGDGLKDGQEVKLGTDPLNADTDKDGLNDGTEVAVGTNPLNPDTDGDGLLDGQENQTCPLPLNPDSDGDGIVDGKDLEPCNAKNPLWTATAIAAALTQASLVPPTGGPTPTPGSTATPFPTNTPVIVPAITNTAPVAPSATPPFPALSGIMVFASNRDGNSEIYALNLASQSLLRLTNNPANDMQPALAPDGMRVAYVSNQSGNNEIYVTGLDRRPPVDLTNNPGDDEQPTWSPDGNWIAFTSNRDGNQEIYIMSSDGSQVRNLTANPAGDFSPTWFSVPTFLGLMSDQWIAFTSNRDGNQEIYRIRPDGTGLTNLTNNPANDYSPAADEAGDDLAFVTDRDGNPEIYTMNTDGGAPTNVTNSFSQDLGPSFDPSGRWLAFSTDRDGNQEVYVIELATGHLYNITRNPAQDGMPDW